MIIIYALSDPKTPSDYRYVGKTEKSMAHRLGRHRYRSIKHPHTHIARWLRSIDLKPKVTVITVTDLDHWEADERYWIAQLRFLGYRLTNATDGGEGLSGRTHTEETKRKMSNSALGRTASLETKAKMSEVAKSRVYSDETRSKLSKAAKNQWSRYHEEKVQG